MRRCRLVLRAIVFRASVVLAFTLLPLTAAAQRPPTRPGAPPRLIPPRGVRPIFLYHPPYRARPVLPIFSPPRYRFWGTPLYGFGLGLGFSPIWWRSCGPFWGWTWGYNCYAVPVYIAGGEGRDLAQLYLKDGTVYNVTDYWLIDSQLHFTTLDESGMKWNEHTIDFSQLDLEKTKDVAKLRGFNFVLRNEPLQQYLQNHPEIGTPGAAPPPSVEPPSTETPQQKR
jgi:hypothetical protein